MLVDGEKQAVVIAVNGTPTGWVAGVDDRGKPTKHMTVDLDRPLAYVKFRSACGVCGWSQQCAMTGGPTESCPTSRPSGIQTGNVTLDRLTARG